MKRVICLLLLGLGNTGLVAAQDFSIRGSNLLRWARGDAYLQGSATRVQQEWFENITNVALSYKDLQMGIRHSLFQPSEFGEEQGGIEAIDFKYLEYRYSNLVFTAGNFYATAGRGLALNLYQDYALNFDSNLEGLKFEFDADKLHLLALRGRSYPSTSPEGSRVRENDLEGVMLRGSPLSWGSLAGYYFYLPEESYPETRMPGGFMDLNLAGAGFYAESALQYVQDGSSDPYYGNYLALDYAGAGYGIVVDYKDYNFKKFGTYSAGGVTSSEPLAYQNPPLVQREFTTNLLARHPHIPLFEDEVGFQVEGTVQPLETLTLVANFSRSSTHRGGSVIPSLHEEDAPFWQAFMEAEHTWPASHFLRLDFGVNEEVKVSGSENARVSYFWQRKQGGAAEGTYYLNNRYSFSLHVESLHLEDIIEEENFWEYYAAFNLSRAPWGGITLSFERTEDPDEQNRSFWIKDYWVGSELDVNFLERHNLLLFVGQDRGGIKCTSGRCRYVDPFEGVKVTLRSTF